MSYTTEELIAVFRLTIPAMDSTVVSDTELESDIEVYSEYVSEKRFRTLYPKALSFFIAHMRTLNDMIAVAVADGSGAGDATFSAGTLISEKEGDLARGYSSGSSSDSDGSDSESLLRKTMYGRMFLQLRDMVIVPVTMRKTAGGWWRNW